MALASFTSTLCVCHLPRKRMLLGSLLECLKQTNFGSLDHADMQQEWEITFSNSLTMLDLRLKQLCTFLAMHPGPVLFHCSRGQWMSCTVASMALMILKGYTSGRAVSWKHRLQKSSEFTVWGSRGSTLNMS